jgi:hypothetical protein
LIKINPRKIALMTSHQNKRTTDLNFGNFSCGTRKKAENALSLEW